jgi:hypothetical protein
MANVGHWVALLVLIAIVWFAGKAARRSARAARIGVGLVFLLLGVLGFSMQNAPNIAIGTPPLMVESRYLMSTMALVFGLGGIVILLLGSSKSHTNDPSAPTPEG